MRDNKAIFASTPESRFFLANQGMRNILTCLSSAVGILAPNEYTDIQHSLLSSFLTVLKRAASDDFCSGICSTGTFCFWSPGLFPFSLARMYSTLAAATVSGQREPQRHHEPCASPLRASRSTAAALAQPGSFGGWRGSRRWCVFYSQLHLQERFPPCTFPHGFS